MSKTLGVSELVHKVIMNDKTEMEKQLTEELGFAVRLSVTDYFLKLPRYREKIARFKQEQSLSILEDKAEA